MKTKTTILALFIVATVILLSFTVKSKHGQESLNVTVKEKQHLNSSDALIMEDRDQWN